MFRWKVERIARLDVECLIPAVDIPDCAVGAEFSGTMDIGSQAAARLGIGRKHAPQLAPAEEIALIAGEAIDHRGLAALLVIHIPAIGGIAHGQPAKVADVFAQGQGSVHVLAFDRGIFVELRDKAVRTLAESRLRLRRPPVADLAGPVIAFSLIVEGVTKLVADDGTDRSEIHRDIAIRMEEGRLENSGGKGDRIARRHIACVDLLNGKWPFPVAGWMPQRAHVVRPVPFRDAPDISDEIVGRDADRSEVVISLGRADVGGDLIELGQSLGAGPVIHPVVVYETVAVLVPEIADHRVDRFLVLGREIPLGIELSDRFAE